MISISKKKVGGSWFFDVLLISRSFSFVLLSTPPEIIKWIAIILQVHAMLNFAEDLEECRKIQFAKFVLLFSFLVRRRFEIDVCVFAFVFFFWQKGIFHIRPICQSHRGVLKIRMCLSVVVIVTIVLDPRKLSNVEMFRFIHGSCCRSRIIFTRTVGRLR